MEARLEHPITLHMMGDWGIANLHRICGWIGAELWRRSPPGSQIRDLGRPRRHRRDRLPCSTATCRPRCSCRPASRARSLKDRHQPARDVGRLRALGTLPQDDRLVFAIDARFGVAEFRRAAGEASGVASRHGVRRRRQHGRVRARIACWKPPELPRRRSNPGAASCSSAKRRGTRFRSSPRGEADAVLFEAVMTPYWSDMCARKNDEFPAVRGCGAAPSRRANSVGARGHRCRQISRSAGPFQALEFLGFSAVLPRRFPRRRRLRHRRIPVRDAGAAGKPVSAHSAKG